MSHHPNKLFWVQFVRVLLCPTVPALTMVAGDGLELSISIQNRWLSVSFKVLMSSVWWVISCFLGPIRPSPAGPNPADNGELEQQQSDLFIWGLRICVFVCQYLCICVSVFVYLCVSICVFIYVFRQSPAPTLMISDGKQEQQRSDLCIWGFFVVYLYLCKCVLVFVFSVFI